MTFCPTRRLLLLIALSFGFVISPARGQTQTSNRQSMSFAAEDLFQRVSPSVFVVETLDGTGTVLAFGSGICVGSELVVTNTHVIEKGVAVRVRHRDNTWPASVERIDLGTDLSVLKVEGLSAPSLKLRPYSTLQVGERIFAIGAPEGMELTLSEGIISGLRKLEDEGLVIQTTASVSHGSSGGGLFDTEGRLVGITTFTLMEGQNLNFAIPTDRVLLQPSCWDIYRSVILAKEAHAFPRVTIKNAQETVFDEIREGNSAVELWPSSALAHYCLGHALLVGVFEQQGHLNLTAPSPLETQWLFQAAIAELKVSIQLNPHRADAHEWLALAYQKTDNRDCAREFTDAIREEPKSALLHYELAKCLSYFGNKDGALRQFRRANELSPLDHVFEADYKKALLESVNQTHGKGAPR
jgi:hypothetical protein